MNFTFECVSTIFVGLCGGFVAILTLPIEAPTADGSDVNLFRHLTGSVRLSSSNWMQKPLYDHGLLETTEA